MNVIRFPNGHTYQIEDYLLSTDLTQQANYEPLNFGVLFMLAYDMRTYQKRDEQT